MENREVDGQEISALKSISISVGKGSKKLSCKMVSSGPSLVESSAFAEAEKRLKKLERDYQHNYEKYTELRVSEIYRQWAERSYYHHSLWVGYCINHCESVVEKLQMVLDKLNTEEAPKRGRDTPSNIKQFFLIHGCKTLAQEKKMLQLKSENKEEYNDDMSQETIDFQRINQEFRQIQRIVPRSSSKKPIHDLLRNVKEIKKMTEKAISNGALVGNHTSQDNMKKSTSIKIKLLTKLIRDLEKERGDPTKNILQAKRKTEKGFHEKMKDLKEKYQCIGKNMDAEKKYILDLKKKHILDLKKNLNSTRKTSSQRKGSRKG